MSLNVFLLITPSWPISYNATAVATVGPKKHSTRGGRGGRGRGTGTASVRGARGGSTLSTTATKSASTIRRVKLDLTISEDEDHDNEVNDIFRPG